MIFIYGANKKQKSNSLNINKYVNKWAVTYSVNEDGKVSLVAWKTDGIIVKAATAGDNEASINLTIDSTVNRVPAFQLIDSNSRLNPQFVEVDERLDRTTNTFKDTEFYRREYAASSILTIEEFIEEMIPSFQALLNDIRVQGYVSKISNEVAPGTKTI